MNRCKTLGLTEEQTKIYWQNYELAKKYFNLQKGWVLHHKDDQLRYTDIDRYIQWNPEDLIPMTKSEHMRLHSGKKTNFRPMHGAENGMYGKGYLIAGENHWHYGIHDSAGENNPMYGKHHSDDTKAIMSEKKKGRHWKLVDGKRVWYD